MDMLTSLAPPLTLAFAAIITVAAGFVKGAVGFAMPLIMISGLSTVMDPKLALAGLIVPTAASNLLQIGKAGQAEALAALAGFWRFIAAVVVMVFLSAQVVTALPERAMFLVLGVPILGLSLLMLGGPSLRVGPRWRLPADLGVGTVAGAIGGISGVWGPPTVLYLLALGVERVRSLAVQGVVYATGSVVLLAGHLQSGVLNRQTLPFSIALLAPAFLGMWLGFRAGDRLDAGRFRRITLVVLVVAGANLIRRGLTG